LNDKERKGVALKLLLNISKAMAVFSHKKHEWAKEQSKQSDFNKGMY